MTNPNFCDVRVYLGVHRSFDWLLTNHPASWELLLPHMWLAPIPAPAGFAPRHAPRFGLALSASAEAGRLDVRAVLEELFNLALLTPLAKTGAYRAPNYLNDFLAGFLPMPAQERALRQAAQALLAERQAAGPEERGLIATHIGHLLRHAPKGFKELPEIRTLQAEYRCPIA